MFLKTTQMTYLILERFTFEDIEKLKKLGLGKGEPLECCCC